MNNKLISAVFKIIVWLLFLFYIIVLAYAVFYRSFYLTAFRMHSSLSEIISYINFVPLKNTIIPYLKGEPSVSIAAQNLLGNILLFGPLGFMLPIMFKRFNRIKNILFVSAAVSLFIELVQAIFHLGTSDIDDIILNVLGSLLGFAVFQAIYLLSAYIYKKYFHGRRYYKDNVEIIERILE